MSQPVHIIAVLPITEGKVDKVKELLQPVIKYVWENEPGCSRYHMHVSQDGKDIVFVETYDSMKDIEKHREGPEYKKFFGTVQSEGLFRSAPILAVTNEVAGFESRSGKGLHGV